MQRGVRARNLAAGAALFGWGPLVWIGWNVGLAPGGTPLADAGVSLERLWRWAYLGWITAKNTPLPVAALALAGLWRLFRQGLWRLPRYRLLVAFVLLFFAAILFSAHGHTDQPERIVSARAAHIPLAAAVFLAGLGAVRLKGWGTALAAAGVLAGLWMADRFLEKETSGSEYQLPYRLARFLDERLGPGERAVCLTPPVPRDSVAAYLDRIERASGSVARRRAAQSLLAADPLPFPYLRTAAHSRFGRGRILSYSRLKLPERDAEAAGRGLPARLERNGEKVAWAALWKEFEPTTPRERELAARLTGREPAARLEQNGRWIEVYRLE